MKYDPIQELNREVSRERSSWIRPFKPLMWPMLFSFSVMALMSLPVIYAKQIEDWCAKNPVFIGWFLVIVSLVLIVKKNLNRW